MLSKKIKKGKQCFCCYCCFSFFIAVLGMSAGFMKFHRDPYLAWELHILCDLNSTGWARNWAGTELVSNSEHNISSMQTLAVRTLACSTHLREEHWGGSPKVTSNFCWPFTKSMEKSYFCPFPVSYSAMWGRTQFTNSRIPMRFRQRHSHELTNSGPSHASF